MLKRPLLGLGVVLAVVVTAIVVPIAADRFERNAAMTRLGSALANGPSGGSIDLAEAFDLDWDRVVIVGAYQPASYANELLGFSAYSELDTLTVSDEDQWVAFARDGRVVADFLIPSAELPFSFAEPNVSAPAADARFTVQRRDQHAELSK